MHADDVIASFPPAFGAYLHVPFCTRICPFCPYNKVPDDQALASRYFAALRREVDSYVAAMQQRPFTSLYVGGGTPTLHLDGIARAIDSLSVTGERAIEVLPTHATPERLATLAAMGFTHISLGVQSFNDDVLRHLKRPTTASDNLRAVANASGRFACVDVDLIFDVAAERQDVFLADVERCFAAGVDQLSTYPLMRFGYTPFGKGGHDARTEHEALARAAELARHWGYERRSVWTFHRPSSPSYTSITRPAFLGLGAGSASFTGESFLVNEFALPRYLARLDAGKLPIAREFHLPRAAAAAYTAFWQTYAGRLDPSLLRTMYGPGAATVVTGLFRALGVAGLAQAGERGFTLTPRGLDGFHDLERFVTYAFIEPLWEEMLGGEPGSAASPDSDIPRWVRTSPPTARRLFAMARRLFEQRAGPGPARAGRPLAVVDGAAFDGTMQP